MKVIKTGIIPTTPENKEFYNRADYKMTGKTLTIEYENGNTVSYIVFTGKFTRYGSIRECNDHYILAGYSSYYRIEKDSFVITSDVEDK